MQNLIDQMHKEKENLLQIAEDAFEKALKIESALSLMTGEPAVTKKPAFKIINSNNGATNKASRTGSSLTPTKIKFGQRCKVIGDHAEQVIRKHGGYANIQQLKKSMIAAGIFKRGQITTPSAYILNTKRFVYDRSTKLYSVKPSSNRMQ